MTGGGGVEERAEVGGIRAWPSLARVEVARLRKSTLIIRLTMSLPIAAQSVHF